jgi:6-pyruvoyl-tetrahydropterin synthase
MDLKFRKFKQQESKSHEKLLKVILQIYKPYLRKTRVNKKLQESESQLSDELENKEDVFDGEDSLPAQSTPAKDYSGYQIKVDDETLEKQRRAEQANKIIGDTNPNLSNMYINGEITLAQLKQTYYSSTKKIDYVCYDNLKSMLGLPDKTITAHQRSRECYRNYKSINSMPTKRPGSASWNFDPKIKNQSISYSITNSKHNVEQSKNESINTSKKWISSIKIDSSLAMEPCRTVNVTNHRKERPVRPI